MRVGHTLAQVIRIQNSLTGRHVYCVLRAYCFLQFGDGYLANAGTKRGDKRAVVRDAHARSPSRFLMMSSGRPQRIADFFA
jgi:hypothetical protein